MQRRRAFAPDYDTTSKFNSQWSTKQAVVAIYKSIFNQNLSILLRRYAVDTLCTLLQVKVNILAQFNEYYIALGYFEDDVRN